MEANPARTVLEQLIRDRHQTQEEFAEHAERFAREHGESGTLSVRHLQRLVAGATPDGTPPRVRPATARLLQDILGRPIGELLSPPTYASVHPFRVAIAVVQHESRVLLVCRRDHAGGITWQFPAGTIKPGQSPEAVAIRETLEETGVTCTVAHTLGSRLHPATRVICDYLSCTYVTGTARNADPVENVNVQWIPVTGVCRVIPDNTIYPPVLDALHGGVTRAAHR